MDPALAVLLEALHRRAGTRALAFPCRLRKASGRVNRTLLGPHTGAFYLTPGSQSFQALRRFGRATFFVVLLWVGRLVEDCMHAAGLQCSSWRRQRQQRKQQQRRASARSLGPPSSHYFYDRHELRRHQNQVKKKAAGLVSPVGCSLARTQAAVESSGKNASPA